MKNKILPLLLRVVLEGIGMTCRIKVIQGNDIFQKIVNEKKSVIFSFWHNRIFFLSYFVYRYCHKKGLHLSVLISQSKDGDIISGMISQVKVRSVRGSTSKGGFSAIKGLLKSIKDGYALVTTPDGPRGPKYKFQSGTIHVSSLGKIPIVPISCTFEDAWVFKSWDKFMVPKPFSRVYVSIGKPVQVAPELPEADVLKYQTNLETVLVHLSSEFIDS